MSAQTGAGQISTRLESLLDHIAAADPAPGIGAPTLVETGIVLASRLGIPGKTPLARFVQECRLRQLRTRHPRRRHDRRK